jgi:hypothetical protein
MLATAKQRCGTPTGRAAIEDAPAARYEPLVPDGP